MDDLILLTLIMAQVVATTGMVVAIVTRSSRARSVGAVLFERREPRALCPVLLAILCGLAIVALRMPEFPTAEAVMTLLLGAILVVVIPDPTDRACGDKGVVSGWTTVEYTAVAEWRLTGQHLRFRVAEEWTAVEVPRESRQKLRTTLENLIPERESRFKH